MQLGLLASAPPRRAWRAVRRACLAVFASLMAAPCWAGTESDDRVEVFVASARLRQLSERAEWRLLLHYRRSVWGGVESAVENREFFLSEQGAGDPAVELEATVRQWFAPASGDPDRHPVCRFPARFAWLTERLELPPRQDLHCPAQQAFVKRLARRRASVFFAASSVRRPESGLGHTFLMLDDDDQNTLGTTIDFRVETEDRTPLLYSFRGLTGLLMGTFEIEPAETRLLHILEEEHRDLWQLELALTPRELERLVLHLWELQGAEFRFYYLTENCSYGVLSVLEAAAPRLELLEHTKFVVIPLDTVRALYDKPGLVRKTLFYPADAVTRSSTTAPRLPDPRPTPPLQALDRAHGPMRLSYGSGVSSSQKFYAELGFRLVYHDLLDPPVGVPELLQIQALHLKVRYAPDARSLAVDEIAFIDLLSVTPLGSSSPVAFRVRAYGDRQRDDSCRSGDSCFVHGVDLRLGASVASGDRALALFVLPGTSVTLSGDVDGVDGSVVRWALGPFGGVRLRLSPSFVGLVTGTLDYLPWQDLRVSYDARAELRWGLSRDVALSVNGRAQPLAAEGGLTSYLYF